MVCDHANLFVKDIDLLNEVCQFISCLNNKFISENVNFQKEIGIDSLDTFNQQLIEELNEYKVYDC